MVQVMNVDPTRAPRLIPALNLVVGWHEVVEVPAEMAGHSPRWRHATEQDDLMFMSTRARAGRTEVYDLGDGLFAQSDVWAAVRDGEPVEVPDPEIPPAEEQPRWLLVPGEEQPDTPPPPVPAPPVTDDEQEG